MITENGKISQDEWEEIYMSPKLDWRSKLTAIGHAGANAAAPNPEVTVGDGHPCGLYGSGVSAQGVANYKYIGIMNGYATYAHR